MVIEKKLGNWLYLIRSYLQLYRAQTAPATTILIMIGFLVGGGQLFSFFGLALFIFAILLHWFIFGNNSLMDSCMVSKIGELPYDAQDEGKTHHPLITGKIKISTAHKVIYTGLIILLCFSLLFPFYGTGNSFLSIAFFLVFIVTGFAYNCGLSKVTIWKFIPISICFTALGGYAYFIMASEVSTLFFLILGYIFLIEVFEISVEGEQKEIETSEVNLLKYLGTKTIGNKIYMPLSSKIWGWSIKLLTLAVGQYIIILLGNNIFSSLFFIFFAAWALIFAYEIINNKNWGRNTKLRFYGLEEICTIYILPSVLIPVIGLLEAVTLMLFGVVYFIIFNRMNWGTSFAPKV